MNNSSPIKKYSNEFKVLFTYFIVIFVIITIFSIIYIPALINHLILSDYIYLGHKFVVLDTIEHVLNIVRNLFLIITFFIIPLSLYLLFLVFFRTGMHSDELVKIRNLIIFFCIFSFLSGCYYYYLANFFLYEGFIISSIEWVLPIDIEQDDALHSSALERLLTYHNNFLTFFVSFQIFSCLFLVLSIFFIRKIISYEMYAERRAALLTGIILMVLTITAPNFLIQLVNIAALKFYFEALLTLYHLYCSYEKYMANLKEEELNFIASHVDVWPDLKGNFKKRFEHLSKRFKNKNKKNKNKDQDKNKKK